MGQQVQGRNVHGIGMRNPGTSDLPRASLMEHLHLICWLGSHTHLDVICGPRARSSLSSLSLSSFLPLFFCSRLRNLPLVPQLVRIRPSQSDLRPCLSHWSFCPKEWMGVCPLGHAVDLLSSGPGRNQAGGGTVNPGLPPCLASSKFPGCVGATGLSLTGWGDGEVEGYPQGSRHDDKR